ncbi:GATA zinc finger domain-containing protein 14-like isoform X1 [Limulus polyphemus]|uniref:GATA zinc finger domain-containing protein 14-like isoform X1 n=1 Tax=Limulus polyphemus TaxID=6850 RepID=A0ABM1S5H1_LIMPO|nr:GATA zinc finger domain-containing protein 14-like isoform X1 [Limulus polyphemus]
MGWKATLLFAGLVWVTYSDSQEVYTPEYDIKTQGEEQTYHSQLNHGWFPYSFKYEVPIGQHGGYSHQESSDESGKVSGSYKVIGGKDNDRVVEYTADENGFHATVRTNDPAVEDKNPADVTVMKDSTLFGLNTPNDNEGFPAVVTRQNGSARDIANKDADDSLEYIGNSSSSYVIYLNEEDSQFKDKHHHDHDHNSSDHSHEDYGGHDSHEYYNMNNSHKDDHDMDNSHENDRDMDNSHEDDYDMDNSHEDDYDMDNNHENRRDENFRKRDIGDTYNIYNSNIYLHNIYTDSNENYYTHPKDPESATVRYVMKYNSSDSLSDDDNMTKQSPPHDVGSYPVNNNRSLRDEMTYSTIQSTKHDIGDTYNIYNSTINLHNIYTDSNENYFTYPKDQATFYSTNSNNTLENELTDSTTESTEAQNATTIYGLTTQSFISTFHEKTTTKGASEDTLHSDTRHENTTYLNNNATFSDIYFNNENETNVYMTTSWEKRLRENSTELADHVTKPYLSEPINYKNQSSPLWLNFSDEIRTPSQENLEQSMATNRDNETTADNGFGNKTNHHVIFFPAELGHLFNSSSKYTGNSPMTSLPGKTPSSYPVYVPVHVSYAGNGTRKLRYGIIRN